MGTILLNLVCPNRSTLSWKKSSLWFLSNWIRVRETLTLIYHETTRSHSFLEVSAIKSLPSCALMSQNTQDYTYDGDT